MLRLITSSRWLACHLTSGSLLCAAILASGSAFTSLHGLSSCTALNDRQCPAKCRCFQGKKYPHLHPLTFLVQPRATHQGPPWAQACTETAALSSIAPCTLLISRLLPQMMLENVFAPLLATGTTPYLMVRAHPSSTGSRHITICHRYASLGCSYVILLSCVAAALTGSHA